MKVLVRFATVEGQNGKIADFATSEIRSFDRDVRLVDLSDKAAIVSFDDVDQVISASS